MDILESNHKDEERNLLEEDISIDQNIINSIPRLPGWTIYQNGRYDNNHGYSRKWLQKICPIKFKLYRILYLSVSYSKSKDGKIFKKFLKNIPFHNGSSLIGKESAE